MASSFDKRSGRTESTLRRSLGATSRRWGECSGRTRGDRGDELDVDLDALAGQLLLIPLPPPVLRLVPLRGRQPVHAQALEDPPHPGVTDLDVVVALEVHRDLGRAEVVVLPQVNDLPCDLGAGLVRAGLRPLRPVPQGL